jgi:hypothetical protein
MSLTPMYIRSKVFLLMQAWVSPFAYSQSPLVNMACGDATQDLTSWVPYVMTPHASSFNSLQCIQYCDVLSQATHVRESLLRLYLPDTLDGTVGQKSARQVRYPFTTVQLCHCKVCHHATSIKSFHRHLRQLIHRSTISLGTADHFSQIRILACWRRCHTLGSSRGRRAWRSRRQKSWSHVSLRLAQKIVMQSCLFDIGPIGEALVRGAR